MYISGVFEFGFWLVIFGRISKSTLQIWDQILGILHTLLCIY